MIYVNMWCVVTVLYGYFYYLNEIGEN